ncbi:response regulator [Magnetovibrio sp. PR-2]|uniref:response regulator n=1 Tax=Magnetovibrio sp. PR-2 TaxID=3120356 RepID=UPI002FCDEB75
MVNVLVIEDDAAVRFSLLEALTAMGHTTASATNGREGLQMCQDETFDLVITDIIMPEKDGVETILELKIEQPDIKIVAISGGGRNVDIMETTYQLGADCALTKPFSLGDLSVCVKRVLGEA